MDMSALSGLWDTAWRLGRVLLIAYVGVALLIYALQRRLQYFPDTERVSPASEGLSGVEEIVLDMADGHRIIAWWAPPPKGTRKPVVLYFHGNGGNISYRAARASLMQRAGMGVLMMTYPGFGGSTGRPTETRIMSDARVAYAWLDQHGAKGRIAVFGESLGSGVAVQLAASVPVLAVVLDSPFSSAVDVAAHHYPYLPVRWLMWDRFESMAHIGKVRAPLLIVHGDQDPVVPHALGRKLFEAANEPKQFVTLPGGGHTEPLANGAWKAVRPFLESLTR